MPRDLSLRIPDGVICEGSALRKRRSERVVLLVVVIVVVVVVVRGAWGFGRLPMIVEVGGVVVAAAAAAAGEVRVVRYPPMERKLWIPSTVMNGGEGREAICGCGSLGVWGLEVA